jgi:hypothetical protein
LLQAEKKEKGKGMKCLLKLSVAGMLLLAMAGCSTKSQRQQSSLAEPMQPASAHNTAKQESPGSQNTLTFTAPQGWIVETPTSSMRKAQYRLPRAEGDSEDAEMAVFYFSGGGGGVQANIDRWTSQFEKSANNSTAGAARTTHKVVHGIPVTIVDISGAYTAPSMGSTMQSKKKEDFRMLAAVAEAGSGPWFFKLTGPSKTVAKWEKSFQSFLDTIQ